MNVTFGYEVVSFLVNNFHTYQRQTQVRGSLSTPLDMFVLI